MRAFYAEAAQDAPAVKRQTVKKGKDISMKGVNKRIIEIEEPENEYIEKVQIFLRQGGNVRVAKSKEEAQRYAQGIVCFKPRTMPAKTRRLLWGAGAMAICLGAVVLGMLFL